MGQYYKVVNEAKGQYMIAHSYDNGIKLMEHSYVGNNFVCAVEAALAPGGIWEGDVVRWEGDYADRDLEDGRNRYGAAHDFQEIKPQPLPASQRFVVNHTRKLFVDTAKQPETRWGMQIHPLPLLICNGNGRGGGDYGGKNLRHVGSWCGDTVATANKVPEGYAELEVVFQEQ